MLRIQPFIHFILVTLIASAAWADKASDQFDFAEGLFIEKDYESAREEYAFYLKKFPTAKRIDEAQFRVGECYFRAGNHEKAISNYETALKAHGKSRLAPLAYYNLGRALATKNSHAKAADAFAAAAGSPGSVIREEAMIGQGESLIKAEKNREAADLYGQFVAEFADSPQAPKVAFSRAWLLLQAGDAPAAESAIRELQKKFPKHEDPNRSRLLLCDALTAQGKYDEASKILNELKSVADLKEEAVLRLAWNRFRAGDKAAAADAFESFAKTYPSSPLAATALYNAGTSRYELTEYDKALVQFDALAKNHGTSPEVKAMRYWKALCLLESKKPLPASVIFAELRNEKTNAERAAAIRFHYARALAAADKPKEATAAYRKLLKEHPDSPYTARAQYGLGTTLAASGETETALKELKAALAAAKTDALADSARFALAEYQYRAGRKEETISLLRDHAAKDDAKPKVIYRCAWAHFDLKEFGPAAALFAKLADGKTPFSHEARYLQGRSLEATKKVPDAITAYQALLSQGVSADFAEKAAYRLAEILPPAEAAKLPAIHAKLVPDGGSLGIPLRLRVAERCFADNQTDTAKLLYEALLKDKLDDDQSRSAWYGMAWCHLRAKDDVNAALGFAKVGDSPIELEMVQDACMQRGEIAFRQEKFADAATHFTVVAKGPKAPRCERAWYMAGWCARKLDDTAGAAKAFQAQLAAYPSGELAADAALRAAEALALQGKHAAAAAVLAPFAKNTANASEDSLLQLIGIEAERGEWREVITLTDTFKKQYPESKQIYLAHFHHGIACRSAGLADKAKASFEATVEATDTVEAAKAQFNLASMVAESGDQSTAAKNYLRVEMLYDYPDVSPKALFHAIEAFLKSGEGGDRRAKLYARKIAEKYPDSDWTKKAQELIKTAEEKGTEQ